MGLQGNLQGIDGIITLALDALIISLSSDSPPALSPRPALFLLGYIASSTVMLEHALWSASHSNKAEHQVDVDTLIRWTKCGDLSAAQEELSTVAAFDHETNGRIVYGSNREARGKL